MRNDVCLRGMIECAIAHIILRSNLISAQQNIIKKEARICVLLFLFILLPQRQHIFIFVDLFHHPIRKVPASAVQRLAAVGAQDI